MDKQHEQTAAIPIIYDGTLYRARGEARWTAVFREQLAWKLEYELQDWPGYIPDLILTEFGICIEVKSGYDPKQLLTEIAPAAVRKARASGYLGPFVVVGAKPLLIQNCELLGVGFGPGDSAPDLVLVAQCPRCLKSRPFRIINFMRGPRCRACRCKMEWQEGATPLLHMWRAAGSVTQYKCPSPMTLREFTVADMLETHKRFLLVAERNLTTMRAMDRALRMTGHSDIADRCFGPIIH